MGIDCNEIGYKDLKRKNIVQHIRKIKYKKHHKKRKNYFIVYKIIIEVQ
jgi:hypothetical protein